MHNTNKYNDPQVDEIDGFSCSNDICSLFSDKYRKIFNKRCNNENSVRNPRLSDKKKIEILLMFTEDDIKNCITSLTETVGYDKIHSNNLKYNFPLLHKFLAKLFSSLVLHNFLRLDII